MGRETYCGRTKVEKRWGSCASCGMKRNALQAKARVIATRDASRRALGLVAGGLEAAEFERGDQNRRMFILSLFPNVDRDLPETPVPAQAALFTLVLVTALRRRPPTHPPPPLISSYTSLPDTRRSNHLSILPFSTIIHTPLYPET